MRVIDLKVCSKSAAVGAMVLLLGTVASLAQVVNLTATPTSALLPDGQGVSMWGLSCTDPGTAPATCASANPNAGANWSPVVITVTPGPLTINLKNSLPVPTSLVIVGQLGGGLGTDSTSTDSPSHASQGTTWPIAASGPTYTPPSQPKRVQSFATEVAANGTTATALTWTSLKPGTYLIESGTHPSIQGPMGLYGVLVVTTPAGAGTPGLAYPNVPYNADLPLVLSEIDPVQNAAVAKAVTMPGFSEATVWSGQPGGCGNPQTANSGNCYPPAVNYSPLYYLINGVSLDRTNLGNSMFATTPATGVTGQVLVRFVNAGLRMHVPSIVGASTVTGKSPASGFTLIAEDGNVLPGVPRIQSEVFLAAGKTYDVMINAPQSVPGAAALPALPVFDRQLSLSANNQRDGGMQGYINVNGAVAPTQAQASAVANPDTYVVLPATPLAISDPGRGVIANDIGVYGVQVKTKPIHGNLSLSPDGTFTYTPDSTWTSTTADSFTYIGNGNQAITASVTLSPCAGTCIGDPPTAGNLSYTSNVASRIQIGPPGVLSAASDKQGHPLTAAGPTGIGGGTVTLNPDGSFTASPTSPPTGTGTAVVTFTYTAVNSQKTASNAATVTVTFNGGSGLKVNVLDAPAGQTGTGTQSSAASAITDYRWIIEEDRTFQVDPTLEGTPQGATVQNLGTNFHTSYMPVVAAGCVGTLACESGQTVFDPKSGQHLDAVCDVGDGACRTTAGQQVPVDPGQVHLDPAKHYYISILPGDAGNSFTAGSGAPVGGRQFSISTDCGLYADPTKAKNWAPGSGKCGHSMGGAQIKPAQSSVNVLLQETPFQPAKIAAFVYEDDFPLNGENDAGGGVDVLAPNEPGLGGFEIRLWDAAGGTGDATGQMTYDMFNMPLSNSLAGTIDPVTGKDACPITALASKGVAGRIITCPKFEADGKTMSPLAGQAVIANMMPGRYGIQATPGADRIGRGEEWLQTNTLDGQKAHDSFIKVGGPAYFQEFGPAGFHVAIGFANPAVINGRLEGVCHGTDVNITGNNCKNTVTGTITEMRQSHPPDQRLYSSGTNDALSFTQCYVSLGDADGEDFAFAKCAADGSFTLTGIPDGDWRLTAFDQWNDQIVDGLSTPVRLTNGAGLKMGNVPVQQWHTNVSTSTFFDTNGNGIRDQGEAGLALVPTNIRFRDGSYSNFNNTDLNGYAQYNEVFPLFNWYVIESDTTRYKQTGVHVVFDGGGPAATSGIAANLAGTTEASHLPTNLRFPGSVYCGNADCSDIPNGILAGPAASAATPSTGRVDPPWVTTEGWQGFIGQYEFLEFGKKPFATGENGGIRGEVIYASTRPFDDPQLLLHTSWTPDVPNVTVNLYQESTAADGTTSLKLVDTTKTSSWDDWAQGFRSDGIPNMNCPGQSAPAADPFYFTLSGTPFYLDQYNATYNGGTQHTVPNNSQFKCYDGLHNFNQVQPAPYDGAYKFPSVTSRDPKTGVETGTNCTVCVANPTKDGTKMLPAGKYVVEMITPPGYELVKEEDKNILIGDNYIAPVVQEFQALANIFILPDQASVSSEYNANNAQNSTNNLGRTTLPTSEGDTGSVETYWPCVGQARVVPDYISLFPGSKEVAPFAGATRNLCDRKEVTLADQATVLAKFWVFSSTHIAAHFTGFILDDLSSEFDPFSPQFGEKFAVPNLPVSIKDFAGNEVERVYADQWGVYNGLNYSTWEVNPPNPTGYAPTMMVACMNDPGNGVTPDPYFNPSYSKFCYEIPYMPGQTQYMDTPVVPTAAFAEGYNPPDCNYPDATPAIASVIGADAAGSVAGASGKGPWVSGTGAGHTLTIAALGKKQVQNPAYTGPQAKSAPYNQKFLTRNYSFGTQCNAVGGSCKAVSSVTIGGVSAPIVSWSDTSITVSVPQTVPSCSANGAPLQMTGSGASKYAAQCGELLITAGSGQKSIDTITVTIGGKPPTYVAGENPSDNAIQTTIDAATPGDLILVGPGVFNEMLLMWKPVRLQGLGAAVTTINANTHPSGKMDPWRRQVACLFGIALNGSLLNAGNAYDQTGQYTCPSSMQGAVDPLPLEGIVGWDTTQNGNLAQLLQEPTLMGAYEGAGVTVLAKGETLSIDQSSTGPNGSAGDFPTGSRPLTVGDCSPGSKFKFATNFYCNPSRIDGFSITNSSQGGGGIFVHGWNHNIEIANNRIFGNAGTLSGGINVGQGESPDPVFDRRNVELPFLFEDNANVHNNAVTQNTSYGDELFSASPSAAGGVTFCTGADNYHFNYNWVCGNLSTGDGGGVTHEGFIYNGDISHNWILFNQSNNITIPTHGGGIAVLGAAPDGSSGTGANAVECGNTVADADCAPGLSDGTGPNLVIDSNVIMGNTAESGSGGGIRLQLINGTEVARLPLQPGLWNSVKVTNNIIANNVAGWDGGGISLQDALNVDVVNNTIASNDTTASAGVLFNTIAAPNGSTPPPGCDPSSNPTCAGHQVVTSTVQAAGLVTMQNTANLASQMPAVVLCPAGHSSGLGATLPIPNGDCRKVSYPLIANDLFWQNRTFHIQVGGMGSGLQSQQNLVTLLPTLNQTATGQCVANTGNYWDIGVRGDTGPTNHSSTVTLNPSYSVLTSSAGYAASNRSGNPNVASQYCNGSRVPPELGGTSNPFGYQVPAGISDATVPNPVFNLTPAATVDEGNNWINLAYGPLSLGNPTLAPVVMVAANGTANGNYGLTAASTSAIGAISSTGPSALNYGIAPSLDLLGTDRKANKSVDIGAIEFVQAPSVMVTGGPLAFGNVVVNTTSASMQLTVTNTSGNLFTFGPLAFTPQFAAAAGGTCGATLATGASCTINVVFRPTAVGAANGTLTINGSVAVAGSPVTLTGTGTAAVQSATLTPATWSPSEARTCPGTTLGQIIACNFGPMQAFTLTNTGNVPLTGVTKGTIGGVSPADYALVPLLSTCGPNGGGQVVANTTLAPGGTCTVAVMFKARISDPANSVRNATVGVTDSAGTQTSALSGLAR